MKKDMDISNLALMYEKTEWVDGESIIDAEKLNNVENGLEKLTQQAIDMANAIDSFKGKMLNTIKSDNLSSDSSLSDVNATMESLRQELYKNILSKFVYPYADDGLAELIKHVANIKIDGSAGPEAKVRNTITVADLLDIVNMTNNIEVEMSKPNATAVINTVSAKELDKVSLNNSVTASLVRANMPQEIQAQLSEVQLGHYERLKGSYFFKVATFDDVLYLFASKDVHSLNAVKRNSDSEDLVFYADTNGIEYYDLDDPSPNMCIWPNCVPYQVGASLSDISEIFQ